MSQKLGAITLVIKDYDEALEFYTKNYLLNVLKT